MSSINMNLCQYSNAFGVPGKGIHSYRIFGIALLEFIMIIVVAYFLYWLLHKKLGGSYWLYLLSLFILGIIFHRLFCVRTTIDKILFP